MSTIFKAEDYLNRGDLEKDIKAQAGTSIKENRNSDYKIQGTRKELKRLHLDDRKTVYGVKVEITDEPTSKLLKEKVAKKVKKPKK